MHIDQHFPITKIALIIAVLFIAITAVSFFGGILRNLTDLDLGWFADHYTLFHVNGEQNIPTWLSAILMAFIGQMLLLIGYRKRRNAAPYTGYWFGLGGLFLLFSLDEFAEVHEALSEPVQTILNSDSGLLFYAWVVPGVLFVLLIFVVYIPFLGHLPHNTRRQFVAAGGVFVSGALGIEALSGYFVGQDIFFLLVHVEEFLEMMGITLFFHAVLTYLAFMDDVPHPLPAKLTARQGTMLTE